MNQEIARQLGLTNATVGKWRRRFVEQGVAGLHDELRPGRPRPISDERVARLVRKTLETKPKYGTHWSIRQMADQTRISKSTVHRIWQTFGLEPHRQLHFKLSTDPFSVEKVRDIVGLYLNPPENAVVLCVDEKSQIQALERTQPMLPIGLGYVEGVTHDYRRHGTTTLFAALDTARGTVITQCRKRHRHQEYLDFLREIDKNVPSKLDVHVVVDNYATHKHPRVNSAHSFGSDGRLVASTRSTWKLRDSRIAGGQRMSLSHPTVATWSTHSTSQEDKDCGCGK